MIRVLVFGMTENPGGVESFIMAYYRNINRDKIQFDFLCNSHDPVAYEDELIHLGGRTFHITARSQNRAEYRQQLDQVFREHASEWTSIWVNVCSLANIDYLKIAKKYGIRKRIIHSHNSQNMDSWLRGILHHINKRLINKYATDYWACSEDAAHWFYDKKLINRAVIIHNAIDVDRMKFNPEKREIIRNKYGWKDKYVIGNVGRLHFQKNQEFVIDIFSVYQRKNVESALVLVGQGEDEDKLREKTTEYGLNNSVFFAGVQSDIQGWLSAFDLFLFPSRFEGLGIAALEAQANGLPVIASKEVIPEEVKMNDNFVFFDLNKDAVQWSDKIVEVAKKGRSDYVTVKKNFIENGYDIETEVGKLERLLVD